MKHILILTFLMAFMAGAECCGQTKNKAFMNENKVSIEDTTQADVEAVLKKQILQGYEIHKENDENYVLDAVPNLYDVKSLEALIPIVRNILLARGFKCDSSMALKRFKEIFKPSGPVFPIQMISICLPGNIYQFEDYGTEGSDIGQFFFSSAGFLSNAYTIPELIDYRKKYPQLAKFEDEYNGLISVKIHSSKTFEKGRVLKWENKASDFIEERTKNIDNLVAINCYVFNNNKAYVPYLISKMPDFVENLISTYGYTKEPAFNKFVLEKHMGAGDILSSNHTNDLSSFGELLFTKDCNKHLEIRKGLLDYIEKNTDSANIKMMTALDYYAGDFLEIVYSNLERHKKYNLSERRKILAYASNVFDKYFITSTGPGSIGLPDNIKRPLLAYVLHYDPAAEQEYKLHNYYGLVGFKELINTIKTTGYWMDGPWN